MISSSTLSFDRVGYNDVYELSFNDQVKSGDASGFVVVFLLLGAPHIYSFLRQRLNRKSAFGVPKAAGWLIMMLAGVLVLLAV